jgi:ketosteroid isomerase-like protein
MSENVALARSIHADWARGDFSSAEWAHPEIELVVADGPEPGTHTGHAGIAAGWRGFLGAWGDYRVVADEYRELDGERVLVLMQHGGYGRASGLGDQQLSTEGANLFHIREGKVARLVLYWHRDCALSDLGLAPEGA